MKYYIQVSYSDNFNLLLCVWNGEVCKKVLEKLYKWQLQDSYSSYNM